MSEVSQGIVCLNVEYSTTRKLFRRGADNEAQVLTHYQDSGGLRSKRLCKASLPDKPLITVIIPVFNGVQHIEGAIESVINQEYDNVECIIIDGGSTDGTLDIIRKFDDRIDLWLSEPDKGVYDAMNKGAMLAAGEWLFFMGSDDRLQNVLHFVAKLLRESNVIYHGDIYKVNSRRSYGGKFSARRLIRGNIPHQAIFYPRSIFVKYRYDLKYEVVADYHLNLLCFCDKEFRFAYIPLLVALFNDGGGLSASCRDIAFENDAPRIIRHKLGILFYGEFVARRILKAFEKKVVRRILTCLRNCRNRPVA